MRHFLGSVVQDIPAGSTGYKKLHVRADYTNLFIHFGANDEMPGFECGRIVLVELKPEYDRDFIYKHAHHSHGNYHTECQNVNIKKYNAWHWSNPGNCGVTPKHAFVMTLRKCGVRDSVIKYEWNKFAKAWGFNPRHGGIK